MHINLFSGEVDAPSSDDEVDDWALKACQRCLIYLGDLGRNTFLRGKGNEEVEGGGGTGKLLELCNFLSGFWKLLENQLFSLYSWNFVIKE